MIPTVGGSWGSINADADSDSSSFKKLVVRCQNFASCVKTLNVSRFHMPTPQEHVSTPSVLSEATGYMC